MSTLLPPTSFEQLLDLWPTPKALSEALELPYVTAQQMKLRKSIGASHWTKFIDGAAAIGIDLSLDDLARMRIRREEETRAARQGAAA
jgi:hypothetical protein